MPASENFVRASAVGWTDTGPGVRRRILTHNDKMMVVEVAFEKGAVGPEHRHPHIQATYLAAGRFEVTISGVTQVLEAGDSFIVPSDELHSCRALEAGTLIDSFTPPRTEFLA